MPPYRTSLLVRETLCAGTAAFHFEKPAGFEFEAGQFANLTLLGPAGPDQEGSTRALSLASAPHERDLMVATRLRPTLFKRTLNTLPAGTQVLLQGPYGGLTLPRNGARPAVLLAGGIGITPFRSLICNADELDSPRRIVLFYSVRVPEEAAFLEDMQEMEKYNGRFKLICTVTRPGEASKPWPGETGRISMEMLAKRIPDLKVPMYYIAGPPGMVSGARRMLIGAGISDEDIRAEEFAGYE